MTGTKADRRTTGDPLVWAILLADLSMFTALFASYAVDRFRNLAEFMSAQNALLHTFGLVNTILLLASSYCVVTGLRALRAGRDVGARRAFALALTLGAMFACVKIVEWAVLIDAGHRAANQFFVYYFGLTGLHFVHACGGLVVLSVLVLAKPERLRASAAMTESGCAFWHVVDLVWIIMFAVLYLA